MNPMDEFEEIERNYLLALFKAVNGDIAGKSDIQTVGKAISLDKDQARKIAEILIVHGLVEIKTLSGGIGITLEGIDLAMQLGASDGESGGREAFMIADEPILNADGKKAVAKALDSVRGKMGQLNLDADSLSELTADLKTLDAQLESPRPKTQIIRGCLRSIRELLQKTGDPDLIRVIASIAGDK